jgi:hypothetical protein
MKKAIYSVIFSLAAIGAASAQAQSTAAQASAAPAPAPYELAVNEFNDYAKQFVLEDGTRVEFTEYAGNYFVKQERGLRMQLIPQSPGVFMTANGARIQFRDHGDTVSIRNVEKLAAKNRAETIVMAKR